MFRLLKKKRIGVVLLLGVVLSLSLASNALAGPPIGKVYGCYDNGPVGLQLVQALELKTKTTYLVAPSYKGKHLSGPVTKGKYKLHGSNLSFTGGAWPHWYGEWTPKHKDASGSVVGASIALLYRNHHATLISCYPV
jgi:hypothetical protein